MMRTIKKYLALDYLYFATPFLIVVTYLLIALRFTTLQELVNSMYANLLNLLMVAVAIVAVPNFCKLVYYTKRTLDLPSDVCLSAAATERFGGAGSGKTSSTLLQAVFEAENLACSTEEKYYYMAANYNRWSKTAPEKLKDFDRIEKSVKFWDEHPEYIPYLVSNVEIKLPDGRKSMLFTRDYLEQKEWLPICFLVIDEGGTMLPQELWLGNKADVVLFFRLIRHFGIRCCICEQKKDGVLINVRAVLGGTTLCVGQRNALLPIMLIDFIGFLKRRLIGKTKRHTLGLFVEKLQDFSSKLGFRVWDQVYFTSLDFKEYIPEERLQVVCTNKMPFYYDDMAYSQLYLAKDIEPHIVEQNGYVDVNSEMGKSILYTHYKQEEELADAASAEELARIKRQNALIKAQNEADKLSKIEEQKANSKTS